MADPFSYASWGTSVSYDADLQKDQMLFQQDIRGASAQSTFDAAYESHLVRLLQAAEQWGGHMNGAASALKARGSQYTRGTKAGCT